MLLWSSNAADRDLDMDEPFLRTLRRAVPIGFALLLALVEFSGVVGSWHLSHATLLDAFCSAALVYALFASAFIFSGLVPTRGMARFVSLAAFHLVVLAAATVLFSSWAVRWLIGQPLNQDAARVLAESPISAILQLNEGSRILLGALLGAMLLFLYLCARMLNYAGRAWSGGHVAPRAFSAAVCVLLGGLSSWGVASASLSWSSYASVVARGSDESAPSVYSCPRSEPVAIAPVPVGVPRGAPVIVIVLESLRGDVLREHPEAMPFFAQLSHSAMVFDKAYAPATHSDFSDISIWYSRYALYADRRLGYPVGAPWRGTSAFEYFKAGGYRTGYFSSQNEAWGEMINWMKLPSMDAFFDAHNLVDPERLSAAEADQYIAHLASELTAQGKVPDQRTLELAADWASRHAKDRFFLGINLQNTHDPYVIPSGGAQPFQPAASSKRDFMYSWPAERAPLVFNRYLNAAYNVDALLAQFAQRLRDAGLWDRSIVLFVGDHGEAFREHGMISHAGPAFEETARVLAVLKLPKGDRRNGRVFGQAVSGIDFIPMLADLSELPTWSGFQGRSPLKPGLPVPKFITVNGLTRGNAVVQWPWKLMTQSFPKRDVELYNIESDPKEMRNLLRDEPEIARQLAATLGEWRTCQISYYADRDAYTKLQPPRY